MKLADLLEAPDFENKQMPLYLPPGRSFYSFETVEREFDPVATKKIDGVEVWVLIRKDRKFAVVGESAKRPSNKAAGLNLITHIDFKDHLDLSWDKEIHILGKNVLQVDGVETYDVKRSKGFASLLYTSLALYGFVLISDTLHYIGGRELWSSLGRTAGAEGCKIYLVDNGVPVMNGDQPLVFDGSNYPADKIWGDRNLPIEQRKKHVLFVIRK